MSDFMTDDGMIDLNFEGVTAASFGALPPGNYLATITECAKDVSKEKQTPFIALTFQVFGCKDVPVPEGAENCNGRLIKNRIYLGEKSLPFAKAFFDALMGDASGSVKFTPSQLVGMNVGLVLTRGTYKKVNDDGSTEDRPNNQIQGYFNASNL